MTKEEIWKDIEGYEGYYQVSNFGRIKSLARKTKNGQGFRPIKESIRKIHYSKSLGYWMVTLKVKSTNDNVLIENRFLVHRLVAKAFIPNPENKPQINHIDANKLNANVSNLEWTTQKENMRHAVNIGTKIGALKGNVPINSMPIVAIKDLAIMEFTSKEKAMKHFKVTDKTINNALLLNTQIKGYSLYTL